MMTVPELDQALIAELTPPCEVESPDCQTPATWIVKAQCPCGHKFTWLFCQPHKQRVCQSRAEIKCEYCGIQNPLGRWPLLTTAQL